MKIIFPTEKQDFIEFQNKKKDVQVELIDFNRVIKNTSTKYYKD